MHPFRAFEKYGKYIVIAYGVLSAAAYGYFHEHRDGRVAMLWIVFILLAAAHLLDKAAKKHFRWYSNLYVKVSFSVSAGTLLYLACTGPLQIYVIRTSSMQPTIYPHNIVIVSKMAYLLKGPQRGEIALIKLGSGTVPMVHRIIACENDMVKIVKKEVTVNGEKTDFAAVDSFESFELVVPKGAYYHKGDNANSHYGVVKSDSILGKIIYVAGGAGI